MINVPWVGRELSGSCGLTLFILIPNVIYCDLFLEILGLSRVVIVEIQLVKAGFHYGCISRRRNCFFIRILLSFKVFKVEKFLFVQVPNFRLAYTECLVLQTCFLQKLLFNFNICLLSFASQFTL
jgi:hypothetical protein